MNHIPIATIKMIAKNLMSINRNIPINFTITNRINKTIIRAATFVMGFSKSINITPNRWYLFINVKI